MKVLPATLKLPASFIGPLATGTIVLLGFCLWDAMNAGDKLQLTKSVFRDYQAYLEQVAGGRTGAFAVSNDGYLGYAVYCDRGMPCDAIEMALAECRRQARMDCSLFARGSRAKTAFETVEITAQLAADDPILQHVVTADRLDQVIRGNSLSGQRLNDARWTEYYAPTGMIYGEDERRGPYQISYTVNGDRICYESPGDFVEGCVRMILQGTNVRFISGVEALEISLEDTVLISGNALKATP